MNTGREELERQLEALQKEVKELKSKLGAPRRMYPIMGGQSVPWEVLAPFESRAQKNHSQSIGRLAERGGLSPAEAWAVVNNLEWREIERIGFGEAEKLWQEYATLVNQHYSELSSLRAQLAESRAKQNQMAIDMIPTTVDEVRWEKLKQENASLRAQNQTLREACIRFVTWYHVDPFKGGDPFNGSKHWQELPAIVTQAEQAVAQSPEGKL